jgi:penicillin-binding protein 1C
MKIKSKKVVIILFAVGAIIIFALYCRSASKKLVGIYNSRRSVIMSDRNHQIISIKTNEDGSAAIYTDKVPENFSKYILNQEDKYFYYHFGINPVSSLRAFTRIVSGNKNRASSTITQQLVKILMSHEDDRNLKNKLTETFGAIALEMTTSKKDILNMYANSIYFGNNVQGIEAASELYFGKHAEELTDQNIIRLVVTIQNPTVANPFTQLNATKSKIALKNYNLQSEDTLPLTVEEIHAKIDAWRAIVQSTTAFEIKSLGITCRSDCTLTIDSNLTENIRSTLLRNLLQFQGKHVDNGAVVVIKEPENELLAVVGSPDPTKNTSGYQINLANSPRPIGSTVKPFIYLKAFEKGLRPYTLADDREYRYPIGTGFSLYPKNYDYTYHGIVTLHEALSNSYNVPAVKTLEYIGTDNFANFLRTDLNFKSVQPLENYALGIALGELEMPLLNLSYYLSIFANHGFLKPLQVKNSSVISRKLQLTRNPQSVGEDKLNGVKIEDTVNGDLFDLFSDRIFNFNSV